MIYGYEKIRIAVLHRDEFKCTICGVKTDDLEVHHIKSRNKGGTDDIENLQSVCIQCHRRIEPREYKEVVKTNIVITKDTRKRLQRFGKFNESYDMIINRLMNLTESKNN